MKHEWVADSVDMDLSEWRQRGQCKLARKVTCSKASSKRMILGRETVVHVAMAEKGEETPMFLLLKDFSTARDADEAVPVKI